MKPPFENPARRPWIELKSGCPLIDVEAKFREGRAPLPTRPIINYHPQSGWFDEGPSKGPPPCGRGLKPPEVLLLLVFFLFLLVADVVPNNGLV